MHTITNEQGEKISFRLEDVWSMSLDHSEVRCEKPWSLIVVTRNESLTLKYPNAERASRECDELANVINNNSNCVAT